METEYSVLMSVYDKEKPENLILAIDSMFNQTVVTNDFVLVCDGVLTAELDNVILMLQKKYGDVINVVRLDENVGLGSALNAGIKSCKHEIIARMDSDDIACPDRCEKQLAVFEKYSDVSICSGTIQEFINDISNLQSRRVLPETHAEILEFAKFRNPFNHPCVMYKRTAVEAAGSYQDFYLLEDYYLWLRMLLTGAKGYNIQDTILYMRAGTEMYSRRAGFKYMCSQNKLFRFMKDKGMITASQYAKSVGLRSASSLAPNWARKAAFEKFLRK